MSGVIDADRLAERLRARTVRVAERRVLIANYHGTDQEKDLSEPANCDGIGRIRHFHRARSSWLPNPLPIEPARRALGLGSIETLRAQVFQNAACNWRCWYCYVPFTLLNGDSRRGEWVTAEELLSRALGEPQSPSVIDLSGGQPDIAPEWVVWTAKALAARGMHATTYLWSDDNLSNDYFWRFNSDADIAYLATYRNYGRVGCFKGFDRSSFAFNTAAPPEHFERQFEIASRLIATGIDMYFYITLTCADVVALADRMARFFDRVQGIHPSLPLRMVPLEVLPFRPVRRRLNVLREGALQNQYAAKDSWALELSRRYAASELSESITSISIRR